VLDFYRNNNVNLSDGSVVVKGIGNVVNEGLEGFVQGDYKVITTQGINGLDGGENFANTNLTFTGNRSHDTDGNSLDITTDAGGFAESYLIFDPNRVIIGNVIASVKVEADEVVLISDNVVIAKTTTDRVFETLRGRRKAVEDISSATTLTTESHIVNCTANTFTIDLPTAVGISGQEYIIKNSGSGTITIDPDGAETIDGVATVALAQWEAVTIVSYGTNWIITSRG
jgi:hypothetical protein